MQILSQTNGHITAADSDDGTVSVTGTPTTRLYGEFRLRDNTTGRAMWRGYYLNDAGKAGDKVPANIWAAAVALMGEVSAVNGAAEDALAQAAALARQVHPLSEQIARDMDRADSDN